MLIFDAHLDIAMNAVQWNRDLTKPLDDVRRREHGMTDLGGRADGVLTLEEMRRGEIGICVATQIGHTVAQDSPAKGWNSPEIAWAMTQAQLAWYRVMEEQGQMVQIVDLDGLHRQVRRWTPDPEPDAPIGYILSLEGADSILDLSYLQRAYEYGLRAVGPAHYGPGRYSPGTGASGGLEPAGRELVKEMDRLGLILDTTHLTDEAFWEALDLFDGPVWASHNNCRALVPHQRQFSDEQLKALIDRGGMIGMAFDAWMMVPGWVRFETTPDEAGVTIATIVDHIDHIRALAGNTSNIGIGSDLDGGYGREQTPRDLQSIADLQQLTTLLADRGYSPTEIEGILHGNWLAFLERAWGGR